MQVVKLPVNLISESRHKIIFILQIFYTKGTIFQRNMSFLNLFALLFHKSLTQLLHPFLHVIRLNRLPREGDCLQEIGITGVALFSSTSRKMAKANSLKRRQSRTQSGTRKMTRRRPRKETRIARGRASVLISMQNVELALRDEEREREDTRVVPLCSPFARLGEPYTDGSVQTLKPPVRAALLPLPATMANSSSRLRLFVRGSHLRCESVGHYRTPSTRIPRVVPCRAPAHVVASHVA